jgi:hypothetical protein
VQVDAGLRADGVVLGPAVVQAVQAAAELIIRIGAPADPEADTLARFRDACNERYESRFVPLLEALDAEAGIGYPAGLSPADDSSPLVAGLPLPRPSASPTWTRRDDVLLRLLAGALRRGETELRLSERDVRELGTSNRVPPAAYHVMATVCAADAAAVDAGEFTLLVRSVNGPAGVSLLGRFCHLTTELRLLVDAQVAAEERLQPVARSPSWSTCRRAGPATSSPVRCCAAGRSRSWAGRAHRRGGSCRWPTSASVWSTVASCSGPHASMPRSCRG